MSTGFFNTSAPREREPSRPKLINPRTGVEQSWQRASNFAAPLDNPFGLKRHHGRQVVRGLNKRVDLARMLLTSAVEGDKVDEVIETALSAAEDEAKANNGSAVHAALGLCDTGKDVPQEYWPHARGYVAELKRWGLRPVAVEQRILNTRLGATGTFDRVYVTDSGRYLVGDIKTGSLKHPHTMAVQCEVYAGADFIVHENGAAPTVEPVPWVLDQDAALIIHVDPDTGATAVYEVPLRVARWGSALAEQVRAFQRTDILMPYSGAPVGPLADQLRREAVADHRDIVAEALGMDDADRAAVIGHIEQHPPARSVVPQLQAATITAGVDLDQNAAAVAGPLKAIIELGSDEYQARLAELMHYKNTKPKLQQMLRNLGWNPSDLAHGRKWLAEKIIQMENGIGASQKAVSGAEAQQLQPSAAMVAQTVEASVPKPEATPFMLRQIAEATSVADIQRIHANLVAQSGEGAWTTAMAEVARTRVAELDAITAVEISEPAVIEKIGAAMSTQDLAQLWARVTHDGRLVSRWTPELDKAAQLRGAELAAAQPPANPNPWGSA